MATTTTTDNITLRFAAACGLLGQYAASRAQPAPAFVQQQPEPTVVQEGGSSGANNHHHNAQQLTIFYGGMVVVLDSCTPEKAAELIRLAAAVAGQQQGAITQPKVDMAPVIATRKESLRRFLSKRKDRASEPPPFQQRPNCNEPEPEPAAKKGKLLEEEAASWLALGSLAWDDPSSCTRAQHHHRL
ncbi:hypothetical protein QOZ80_3BG0292080 [Eleusine coracana subsp. coracana]|nr:hypothetical protein QOZ80_3BG0292080 [Eleusine coracana subsp. coracana]